MRAIIKYKNGKEDREVHHVTASETLPNGNIRIVFDDPDYGESVMVVFVTGGNIEACEIVS